MRGKQWFLALLLGVAPLAGVRAEIVAVHVDEDQVARWNRFAEAVYGLHQQLTAGHAIRTESETGGYKGFPDFYKEVRYYDKESGRLLSKIQWERVQPERIHAIEVYVYDDRNRVVRDYSAWFLPYARNAPRGTWITFYAYRDGLRAWRQFDASDNRVYEQCEGAFRGQPVNLSLWEMDLIEEAEKPDGLFTTAAYRACFAGLPVESAGKYLTPQ